MNACPTNGCTSNLDQERQSLLHSAVRVPRRPTIEAVLAGMLGNRAKAMARGTKDSIVQFWGIAAVDEHTAGDLACAVIDPDDGHSERQIVDCALEFAEKFPGLWGYGVAWVGWVEVFASPAAVPPQARIAALFGTLPERSASEAVVGATVYDATGAAHTSFIHVHAPDLGISNYHSETWSQATGFVTDFERRGLAAHACAAALCLDEVGNREVIERLRAHLPHDKS